MQINSLISRQGQLQTPQIDIVAEEFEAAFIAQMLKHTGISGGSGPFSGGIGEEQFAPMLIDHYAQALVRAGGMGLAENVAQSLLEAVAKDG